MTVKAKILFISYSGPLPSTDGKRQRTLAMLKSLEEEYKIDYVIVDNKVDYNSAIAGYKNPAVNFLFYPINKEGLGYRLRKKIGLLFGHDRGLRQYIRRLDSLNNYVFTFVRYIYPVNNIPQHIKIVCDIDDDFEEVYKTRIKRETVWLKRMRLKQIYLTNLGVYKRLLKRLDLPLFVKEENKKQKGLLVPNLPFQFLLKPPFAFRPCISPSILFVGKLSYEPNLLGILWFLKEVWPDLIKKLPSIRLTLVSNAHVMDNELLEILSSWSEINLLINVENLAEVYQNNALVIAPIFQGGGSSIKIVEALLMGRPIVTTSFGARGFKDVDNKYLISQDSSNDYLAAILSFFESVDQLPELQEKIHHWAKSKYSFDRWKSNLLLNLRNF